MFGPSTAVGSTPPCVVERGSVRTCQGPVSGRVGHVNGGQVSSTHPTEGENGKHWASGVEGGEGGEGPGSHQKHPANFNCTGSGSRGPSAACPPQPAWWRRGVASRGGSNATVPARSTPIGRVQTTLSQGIRIKSPLASRTSPSPSSSPCMIATTLAPSRTLLATAAVPAPGPPGAG